MPKAQRKPEEIESVKEKILSHAVDLINRDGYKGFSMRKLAARLEIAAKTIYNYYRSKDELYLLVLARGFERLHRQCINARRQHTQPFSRINAIIDAYVDFGLRETHFYNLMFTWHVPKFDDYAGTDMEPVARVELKTALQVADLFIDAIKACAAPKWVVSDGDARALMIYFWIQAHGFIAGNNNSLLNYMHEDPLGLKDRILDRMKQTFRDDLRAVCRPRLTAIPSPSPEERRPWNNRSSST
jgi:AcrR family transcriptional regulator